MALSSPTRDVEDLLPLTDLAFGILVCLSGERHHGYALIKTLRSQTGRERLRTGTVYAALARLEEDGLVVPAEPPQDADDPRRRYYRITPLGATVARAEARRLRELLERPEAKALLAGGLEG